MKKTIAFILFIPLCLILSSCASTPSGTVQGGAIGAAGGALLGAGIATATGGNAGTGAIVGAIGGAVAGSVIGSTMDQQADNAANFGLTTEERRKIEVVTPENRMDTVENMCVTENLTPDKCEAYRDYVRYRL